MAKAEVVGLLSFIAGFAIMGVLFYTDVSSLISPQAAPEPEAPQAAIVPSASPAPVGNITWGPASDPVKGTILVVAAHDEPLDWLSLQPYQPIVMVKGRPEGTPNNLVKNYGREAASYLQFIIEHYDNLPPRMIFVHGHNSSWHLKDVVAALNAIDVFSYEFATFSNMFMCFRGDFVTMTNCWADSNATRWFGPLPVEPLDPYVGALCCATFLVTKERVLGRSLELYKWLLNWVLNGNTHDSISGRCLEWSWHFIMGEPWRSYAVDPTLLCPSNPRVCALENINQAHP